MEIFGIRLLVKDFAAAVHFWRDLMKISLQFQDEAMGYAYFDTGKGGLELMNRDAFASSIGEDTPVVEPQGHQMVLNVRVDDVDSAYAELVAQGVISVAAPVDRPAWNARTAHISDPDGHVLELFSMLSPTA
jgi:lactoylglutathione lyase